MAWNNPTGVDMPLKSMTEKISFYAGVMKKYT